MSDRNYSEFLTKVLNILKYKKAGKKVIKEFEQFRRDFEEVKESFWLTYNELYQVEDKNENKM